MLESYSNRVVEVLANRITDIQQQHSSGHARRCTICGEFEFDGWGHDYEAGYRHYAPDCPHGCGIPMKVFQWYIRVIGHTVSEYTLTRGMGCRGDCPGVLVPPLNASTLIDWGTYTLPIPKVLNRRIENHHVSYEPEITVPVCSPCHGRIHGDNGELEAFEPDQSRSEWEGA